ncbi:MAG: ABC transporter ATP-binding protein [Alphaproteobacteria bacterium]
MAAVLIVRGVTRRAPSGAAVLSGVSLEVEDGEVMALLGGGGAGKTTLLRIVAGLDRASEGEVRVLGTAIADRGPGRAPVSLMFQSEALFPHLSVADNVAYGLGRGRRLSPDAREMVDGLLTLVGLGGKGGLAPNALGPVERRRVAFARGLARRPRLLLLDAPTAGLDDGARTAFHATLADVQRATGIAYLLATDDPDEAQRLGDRIAVLEHGVIAEVGTPAALRERPASRAAARLVARMNLLPGRVTTSDGGPIVHIEGVGQRPITGAVMGDPRVTLGVPPAAITVARDGPRELHVSAVAGFVRGFPFVGGCRCVLVEASAGARLVAVLPPVPLREGDAIWIDWDDARTIVFDG